MGNGEADTPTKTSKSASTQEPPPSSPATVYPDWASFQAYYNSAGTPPIPPPGFFHSPVPSSPQTHPYMWGQHMMPPYGTPPPPYVTMYPHGGLYGHPSLAPGSHPYAPYAMPSLNGTAEAPVAASGIEVERQSEGKKRSALKKSKGSLGSLSMLTGKGNESGKTSGTSVNGVGSQSAESESEGSSEGSDASSQNGSQQKPSCEQGSASGEDVQNRSTCGSARAPPSQSPMNQNMTMMGIPQNGVTSPTTNLNIGMDYWGGPASSVSAIRSKAPPVSSTPPIVPNNFMGSREGVPPEQWLQDERELKRQRRKQSNRESARRSRLRKQAECEELTQRVENLKEENCSLREEIEHMREECQKLAAENASLTERLEKHQKRSQE
ncbi:bZIP transcription factor 1-A-like isoform X1 [Aristolochia californica]|uniref:bZIP transcription factor 1-A-like isoform X1 n=1 Tax=Aristolochia californica TaxID=171875 RepID=UPI0035DFB1B4